MKIPSFCFVAVAGISALNGFVFGQDDEARQASGLPSMIGRRGACTNAGVGADALVSGSLTIQGFEEKEKAPQLTVSLFANGVLVAREWVKNNGAFSFSCAPRSGVALVVEVDGLEIGRYPMGSLNPPPLSNRQDVMLTWGQISPVVKLRNEVISLRNSYQRTEENQKTFDKAVSGLKVRKPQESIKLLASIVEKDPNDHVAWAELGNVYFIDGKLADAENAYSRSLGLKADFLPTLLNLGKLHLSQKKLDQSIEILSRAVAVAPNSADVNHYLGEAYLLAKKGSKAVGYLYKAIELAPVEKAEIHLRLAALYHAANVKDRAATEYKLFLQKVPTYPERAKLEKYIAENTPKN